MAPKRGPNGVPGNPANDALGNPQTALREVLQTALREVLQTALREVLQTALREVLQTTSREVLQRRPSGASGASEPGTRGPGPAAALAHDGRSPFYSVAENIFLLFE